MPPLAVQQEVLLHTAETEEPNHFPTSKTDATMSNRDRDDSSMYSEESDGGWSDDEGDSTDEHDDDDPLEEEPLMSFEIDNNNLSQKGNKYKTPAPTKGKGPSDSQIEGMAEDQKKKLEKV
jgi:hypothetical protein